MRSFTYFLLSTSEHVICHVTIEFVRGISKTSFHLSLEGSPCSFNGLCVYSTVVWIDKLDFVVDSIVVVLGLQPFNPSIECPPIRDDKSS